MLAGAWILDEHRRVLLIHRQSSALVQWETPGGKVEWGESPAETARREIAEELGVEAKIAEDLGWFDFESGPYKMRYALFRMSIARGDPHPAEPEKFDRIGFFSIAAMCEIHEELSANAKNLLAMYFAGEVGLAASVV